MIIKTGAILDKGKTRLEKADAGAVKLGPPAHPMGPAFVESRTLGLE